MAKKDNNKIGDFFNEKALTNPELMMRECFLRTCREALDNAGIEEYTLDQIRGATMMLEHYKDIRDHYAA